MKKVKFIMFYWRLEKQYGHDHENSEYDEDYKELIDYLISRGDKGI